MDNRGIRVGFPTVARDFSLLHSSQTGSAAHSASYPVNTGTFSSGKAAGDTHLCPVPRLRIRGTTSPFPKRVHGKVSKGAHTRSIVLRKIVLRNTSLPIHDQVSQHHTRSIMLHNTHRHKKCPYMSSWRGV
jgi:hypothetical protein